jgi:hypothetical protein
MPATSAKHNATDTSMTPTTPNATQAAGPRCPASRPGKRKMPVPMMPLMPMQTTSNRPRRRRGDATA